MSITLENKGGGSDPVWQMSAADQLFFPEVLPLAACAGGLERGHARPLIYQRSQGAAAFSLNMHFSHLRDCLVPCDRQRCVVGDEVHRGILPPLRFPWIHHLQTAQIHPEEIAQRVVLW